MEEDQKITKTPLGTLVEKGKQSPMQAYNLRIPWSIPEVHDENEVFKVILAVLRQDEKDYKEGLIEKPDDVDSYIIQPIEDKYKLYEHKNLNYYVFDLKTLKLTPWPKNFITKEELKDKLFIARTEKVVKKDKKTFEVAYIIYNNLDKGFNNAVKSKPFEFVDYPEESQIEKLENVLRKAISTFQTSK